MENDKDLPPIIGEHFLVPKKYAWRLDGELPPGLWESMKPKRLPASHFGWHWDETPKIAALVDDLNDREFSQSLLDTQQFKAIEWLMEVGAGKVYLQPTIRGEFIFTTLAEIQINLLLNEPVTVKDLIEGKAAIGLALEHQEKVLSRLERVPESVRRFGYDFVTDSVESAVSNLRHRFEMVTGEIDFMRSFTRPDGKPYEGGHSRNWVADLMLRNATDIYLNLTGYEPQKGLPVMSFEGFLTRFCRGVPTMEGTGFANLASAAMTDGAYKGSFIAFAPGELEALRAVFPKFRLQTEE